MHRRQGLADERPGCGSSEALEAAHEPVDRRADIWAFGAVLYEMLTGQRAFPGEEVTETIVAVISREPDFAALPATVPGRVGQVLRV